MSKTLEQIIGYESLTRVITSPDGGVPTDLLPPGFMTLTTPNPGNTAVWNVLASSRKNAGTDNYGSASKRIDKETAGQRSATMLHTFKHISHPAATLMKLKAFDSPERQIKGQQEVDRQTAEFRRKLNNQRMSAIYSVLRHGIIYRDADGNILPSSSGETAGLRVDMGVPSGNKNQLDVFGSGAIIGASWATSTTKIHTQIANIKKASRKKTGRKIVHAFYGEDILDYLLKNDNIKQLLNSNSALATAFAGNEIPNGFLGLQWHPVSEAFFEDSSGTNQDWFAGDIIVFTPEPDPSWWTMNEGSYMVPTSVGNVSADGTAALGDLAEVTGMFSYAKVNDDPPGIKHFMGDTFLPTLLDPGAIFIADVIP